MTLTSTAIKMTKNIYLKEEPAIAGEDGVQSERRGTKV
jgi:hypothetical protein